MRVRIAIGVLGLALVIWPASFFAVAAQDGVPTVAQALDEAFVTLKTTADRREAKHAEQRIINLWLESGSDTIDLLMDWTLSAVDEGDYALALDYLDRVTLLSPDYAEGWNKRATVFFLIDDYAKSIADIERVLALEPRHFGAMSGLGIILQEIGDESHAIEVFEQALGINPTLDEVREALAELRDESAGAEI